MLTVLSPAKALSFDVEPSCDEVSRPYFDEYAAELVEVLRPKTVSDLRQLMSLSEDLAALNAKRFQSFGTPNSIENRKPAVLVFAGDTYQGLKADDFNEEEMAFAQRHLRILSGLYGALRPLDLIEPYRLEMGTRLKTAQGHTLYEYWGARVAEFLMETPEADVVLNCASQEYFKVVAPHLKVPVVTPQFKEERNGSLKMISFFAKRARGAMARFAVTNRISSPAELAGFDWDGYQYRPELSSELEPVFTRMSAAA